MSCKWAWGLGPLKILGTRAFKFALHDQNQECRHSWNGDYQSVKCLVAEYLKFDDKWDSSGGEKIFYCDDSQTIVWLSKKKLLQIDGVSARFLQRKLISSIYDVNVNLRDQAIIQVETLTQCECPETACRCNELITELDGVKLQLHFNEQCRNYVYNIFCLAGLMYRYSFNNVKSNL